MLFSTGACFHSGSSVTRSVFHAVVITSKSNMWPMDMTTKDERIVGVNCMVMVSRCVQERRAKWANYNFYVF